MMNLLYTNNKSLLFNFADRQGWQNRLYAAIVADRVRLAKSATLP